MILYWGLGNVGYILRRLPCSRCDVLRTAGEGEREVGRFVLAGECKYIVMYIVIHRERRMENKREL